MEQEKQKMAKFEQAKAFLQTLFTKITDGTLSQLKQYLRGLQKDISNRKTEFISQYTSVTDLLDCTMEGKGKSAMHFAAARGSVEIYKYLVDEYKLNTQVKDKEKNTPFFTAVQHSNMDLVKYMIEELNESQFTLLDGNASVLHIAANNGCVELINYFLDKGCDIEKLSTHGKPLDWAVGSNRTEAAFALLDRGANPNGDATGSLPAPIFIAADYGNTDVVNKLIEKGADLNVKDPEGSSLLQVACEKGNLELVKNLMNRGHSPQQKINGKTCYYLAFENNRFEVVEYLKSVLAAPHIIDIENEIKQAKEKAEASKISKEEADKLSAEFKKKGNDLYGQKKYEEAIQEYTRAIEVDPSNNILYANRAACYLALKNYEQTLEDCGKSKKLNPSHVKTLVREAQAYTGLNNYIQAAISYWEALKSEPNNKQVYAEFQKCTALAKQANNK